MRFNFNITDFLKLPTKIMFSITIVSGMILFLPDHIVAQIYMLEFRNNYGFAIGLLFLTSFSKIIITLIIGIYKYFNNKYLTRKLKLTRKKILQKLEKYHKAIVYFLYMKDNHTSVLPFHDGAVKYLKQNAFIVETADQYIVDDVNNFILPYILQPWVVEELQNNKELLNCFSIAYNQIYVKYKKTE